jgi:hypothetical protein
MNFDDPNLYSNLEDKYDNDDEQPDTFIKNTSVCKCIIWTLLIIFAILIINSCMTYKTNNYDDDYVFSFGPDVKVK